MDERQSSIFDRLVGLIPGYEGFAEKEKRRTADQALRRYLGQRIDDLKTRLHDVARAMTDAGQLDGLADLDRLRQRIGTCADLIRNAPYGESGWTDDWVVTAEDLALVHEHDQTLDEGIDELTVALAAITPETIVEKVKEARDLVDGLRRAIGERDALLSEVK